MPDRLIYRSRYSTTSIEISEDHTKVVIFHDILGCLTVKLAEFQIDDVWDMLRDALINIDHSTNLVLMRRKEEALVASEWLAELVASLSRQK